MTTRPEFTTVRTEHLERLSKGRTLQTFNGPVQLGGFDIAEMTAAVPEDVLPPLTEDDLIRNLGWDGELMLNRARHLHRTLRASATEEIA